MDGFRVDVAHSLVKEDFLPDTVGRLGALEAGGNRGPMWDQEGVHDIYRHWHDVVDAYPGDRILVAEAWVSPADRLARYVRPDEMQQAFNFPFMLAGWDAGRLRDAIGESLAANRAVGATTTWVLSNHDSVRHATRLALADQTEWSRGIAAGSEQPDAVLGLRRARAATLMTLALPGSAYLYQGEELGLPEHTTLPASARQDPTFLRTGGAEIGRDGCRVPLPWRADAPGFGPGGTSWLPQPESFRDHAADLEERTAGSTLELYRRALGLRRQCTLGTSDLTWLPSAESVLDFVNGGVRVMVNLGTGPVALPAAAEVILESDGRAIVGGTLTPDSAVWLSA